MIKYAKCHNCGEIHYVITKEEADALKKEGYLIAEFSDRNMAFCSYCGCSSKDVFSEVTEEYVEDHSDGSLIQPILLDNGNQDKAVVESKK